MLLLSLIDKCVRRRLDGFILLIGTEGGQGVVCVGGGLLIGRVVGCEGWCEGACVGRWVAVSVCECVGLLLIGCVWVIGWLDGWMETFVL